MNDDEIYQKAQESMVGLKSSALIALRNHSHGLRCAELGRILGTRLGYNDGHYNDITRALLAELEREGSVFQTAETWMAKG